MADIGYSFQPGASDRITNGANASAAPGGGQVGPLASQALRVLSLRLPTILGGRPVAPADLLAEKLGGGAGAGNPSSLADLIRRLLGPGGASQPGGGSFNEKGPMIGGSPTGAIPPVSAPQAPASSAPQPPVRLPAPTIRPGEGPGATVTPTSSPTPMSPALPGSLGDLLARIQSGGFGG